MMICQRRDQLMLRLLVKVRRVIDCMLATVVLSFLGHPVLTAQTIIGGGVLEESAMLDVQSATAGVLLPRMTEDDIDNIVAPAQSLVVFNTTSGCLQINLGTTDAPVWESIICRDLAIGDTHEGGIVFYLDGNGGGLVAAPTDQSSSAQWGCLGTDLAGDDASVAPELEGLGNGQANTTAIVNNCAEAGRAAKICDDLELGGYSDWFLPSKDELNLMYQNIGPGATGANENIGNFAQLQYWSSTEVDDSKAWFQHFGVNVQNETIKFGNFRVRAIRSF